MGNLGIAKSWQMNDVYGLDDDLLAIVPQPVAAVLLLYPLTEKVCISLFKLFSFYNILKIHDIFSIF